MRINSVFRKHLLCSKLNVAELHFSWTRERSKGTSAGFSIRRPEETKHVKHKIIWTVKLWQILQKNFSKNIPAGLYFRLYWTINSYILLLLILFCFCWFSAAAALFSDPVICYFLDTFLMLYCLVATTLFFKEKVSLSKTVF